MGKFGDDLRIERTSRGMALEDITAVTKISQRHLVALEEGRFSLLPGGILSKGIVRGYAGALGLDQNMWTERFLNACSASGQSTDPDRDWTAFAANVGKARLLKREAAAMRLRWAGAGALAFFVLFGGYLTVRFYGYRAGWWPSVVPASNLSTPVRAASLWFHSLLVRISTSLGV